MVRAVLSGILLFAICNPALAQEPNVMLWSGPQIAHAAITVLGLVLATGLALQAFARPVQFANVPTFPRYMTSAQQYRLGKWIFVAFACGFFVLLVYRHKEVATAASAFEQWLPDVLKKAVGAMQSETESYVLVVAGMGALYLFLLTHEAPWNVLLMMRNTIRGWISIPELGRKIVAQIHLSLQVPPQAIPEIASPSLGVSEADFGKGRTTPDRQWAEICYMRWWLTPKQEAGGDATFFVEQSFSYDNLISEFDQIALVMRSRGATGAAEIMGPIANSVKKLHGNFSRLVACYLIYRNASRERLNQEARTFGIDVSIAPPDNPVRYWIVYVIALMASVYVGVHVSAVVYDWFQKHELILAQDANLAVNWMMYSLSNYGLAIVVVLLIRFIGGPQLDRSHLITYCWTFAVALVVGPFGLTLAVHFFGPDDLRKLQVPQLFFEMLKWGLGPALVSVYISYYLDRQTARDLPDIDHSYSTRLWRLLNCLGFAAVTVFLLLPPLLSIPARPGDIWDASKLQFVAAGSTFFVAFGLALAAQFALRKRRPAGARVVTPPAGGLAAVG